MKMKKIYRLKIKKVFSLCDNRIGILFLLCFLVSNCTYRSFDEPKSNVNSASAKKISDFDRELKAMRTADFDYIFALKRKDGKSFDSDDKAFVKENKHYAANRFIFVDDQKILFVGSNFEFSEENLNALQERFDVEDYSKPAEELEKIKQRKELENSNINTKENQNK